MVKTCESEDVGTRVRPHCDGTQAFAELRYGVVIHTRENSVKYGHNFIFNQTLYIRVRVYPAPYPLHTLPLRKCERIMIQLCPDKL